MSIFMSALGIILVGRLFMLTVAESDKWKSFAEDMSVRAVYETAPRGDILDRNGNVIATSRAVYSVNINRSDMDKESMMETASSVMALLQEMNEDIDVTMDEVRENISDSGYYSYMPITLAEDISETAVEAIKNAGYKGVNISTNYVREYPNGAFASHILGYLGRITPEEEEEYVDEKGYRKDAPK